MTDLNAQERYYITGIIVPPLTPDTLKREKMEPFQEFESITAHLDNHIFVKITQEEVLYMPDYIFNDRGEIEEVQYNPVPVREDTRVFRFLK